MERTVYGYAFFFSFAFEEARERVREVKREKYWDRFYFSIPFYFSVPLKNERSVLCEGIVCLETVSMETKVSFFTYIHQGATVLSVRDFIPNFRPPSHEIDYLCPHKYK